MVTQSDETEPSQDLCPSCKKPLASGHGDDCPEAPEPLDESNAPMMIGRIIDHRYQLEAVLGIGGMGVVYRARHILIEKRVALKVLRRPQDERARKRFREEARILSSIEHEAVVSILDYGVLDDGRPYLVMALIAGQSLAEVLRSGPLSPPRACRIVAQAAQGLAAVHAHGIIHRDVKPEHLILVPTTAGGEQVRIIDFGIALLSTTKRITNERAVVGTRHYIAPEQRRGRDADVASDQYALGVVLFELLTGELPTVAEPLEPGDPSFRSQRWPPGLTGLGDSSRQIVARMLAPHRAQRFPSMDAVAQALNAEADRLLGTASPARQRASSLALGWGGLAVVAAVASGLSVGLWSLLTALSLAPKPMVDSQPLAHVQAPPPVTVTKADAASAPTAPVLDAHVGSASLSAEPATSPVQKATALGSPKLPHPIKTEPPAAKPLEPLLAVSRSEPGTVPREVTSVLELRILQPPDDEVHIVCSTGLARDCRRHCALTVPRSVLAAGKATCTITAAGFRQYSVPLVPTSSDAAVSERISREVSLEPVRLDELE